MRELLARLFRRPSPWEVRAVRAGFYVGHRVTLRHPTGERLVEGTLISARESQLSLAWHDLEVEHDDGLRIVYAVDARSWVTVGAPTR